MEDEALAKQENPPPPRVVNIEDLKCPNGVAPKGLPPCAADAYLLFQVNIFRSYKNVRYLFYKLFNRIWFNW